MFNIFSSKICSFIIRKTIDLSKGLTEGQKRMLKEAEDLPYEYDPQNPPLTEEELSQFHRVSE